MIFPPAYIKLRNLNFVRNYGNYGYLIIRFNEFLYLLNVARMGITTKEIIIGQPLTRSKFGLAPIPGIAESDHISFHLVTIFLSTVYPLSFRLNVTFFAPRAVTIVLWVVGEVIYVSRNPAF